MNNANYEIIFTPKMDEYKLTQSNDLVEASYQLSTSETRLLMMIVSQLNSGRPPKTAEFTIHAKDYAATFNLSEKRAYNALKEISESLFAREIKLKKRDGKGQLRLRWIYKQADYLDKLGTLTIGLSPDILYHLTGLHKKFTSIEFKEIKNLEYRAYRFYALFKNIIDVQSKYNKKSINKEMTLEEIRDLLDIPGKYPRFCDFQRWVLDPSVNSIKEKTSIDVTWEKIKKGRATVGINFCVCCLDNKVKLIGEGKHPHQKAAS